MKTEIVNRPVTCSVDKSKTVEHSHTDSEGNTCTSSETIHWTELVTKIVQQIINVPDPEPPANENLAMDDDDLYAPTEPYASVAIPEFSPAMQLSGAPEGFDTTRTPPTFNGTNGDDAYTVSQDASGDIIVTNDNSGTAYTLPAADAAGGVNIRTHDGDDSITIDPSVTIQLNVHGQGGNDTIDARGVTVGQILGGGYGDDTIYGSEERDIIDGHSGDDTISANGGNDEVEGGNGNDTINGGAGDDQLTGQDGDDVINGGTGHDFIMGNEGADTIDGGEGSDAIYADADDLEIDAGDYFNLSMYNLTPDQDVDLIVTEDGSVAPINAGSSDVTVTYDPEATQQWLDDHPEFVINGDADFRERTFADFGVMLSTTQGADLLDEISAELVAAGETLRIAERFDRPGGGYDGSNDIDVANWATIYNGTADPGDEANRHPLPALFHELVHAHQDLTGNIAPGYTDFTDSTGAVTGRVRNAELETTGLSYVDSAGNVIPENNYAFSDNLFRIEIGLPEREVYGSVGGTPTSYSATR